MLNELTSGGELDFEKELDEAQRSLREVTLMIEQCCNYDSSSASTRRVG